MADDPDGPAGLQQEEVPDAPTDRLTILEKRIDTAEQDIKTLQQEITPGCVVSARDLILTIMAILFVINILLMIFSK